MELIAEQAIKIAPGSLPNNLKSTDSSKGGMKIKFKVSTNKVQKPVVNFGDPDEEEEGPHDRHEPAAPETKTVCVWTSRQSPVFLGQFRNIRSIIILTQVPAPETNRAPTPDNRYDSSESEGSLSSDSESGTDADDEQATSDEDDQVWISDFFSKESITRLINWYAYDNAAAGK